MTRSYDSENGHRRSSRSGERSTFRSKENGSYDNLVRCSTDNTVVETSFRVFKKQTPQFQPQCGSSGTSPENVFKEKEKVKIQLEHPERVKVDWVVVSAPPKAESHGGQDTVTERNVNSPFRLKKSAGSYQNDNNVMISKEFLFSKFFETNKESPIASPPRPTPGSPKSSVPVDLDNVVAHKQPVLKVLRRQKAFDGRELGQSLGGSVDTVTADAMHSNNTLAAGARASEQRLQAYYDNLKTRQREFRPAEMSKNDAVLLMSAKKAAEADRQRFLRALQDQGATQSSSSNFGVSSPEQDLLRGHNTPDVFMPARKGHRMSGESTSLVNVQFERASLSGDIVRVVKENANEGIQDCVSKPSIRIKGLSESVDRDDFRFFKAPAREDFKMREGLRGSPITKRQHRQGTPEDEARYGETACSCTPRMECTSRKLSVLEKLHLNVSNGRESNPGMIEPEETRTRLSRRFRETVRSKLVGTSGALEPSVNRMREPSNRLPKDVNVAQKETLSEIYSGNQIAWRGRTDDRASNLNNSGEKIRNSEYELQNLHGPSKIGHLLQKKSVNKIAEAGDSCQRVDNFDETSKIICFSKAPGANSPISAFPSEGNSEDTHSRLEFRRSISRRRLLAVPGLSVPKRSEFTGDWVGLSRGNTNWVLDEGLSTISDSNSFAPSASPRASPSPKAFIVDENELVSLQCILRGSNNALQSQSQIVNPEHQKPATTTCLPNCDEGDASSVGESSPVSVLCSPFAEECLSPLELKLQELQRRVNDSKRNKVTRECLRTRSQESSEYDIRSIEHTAIVKYAGCLFPSQGESRLESAIVKYETASRPKDDNKLKGTKLPPEVVTFEPPVIKSPLRNFVDGAIDIDEIPCDANNVHDLAYVRDVLVASGFTRNDSETCRKWHSSYPIDPALFQMLERYQEKGATFLGGGIPDYNIKRRPTNAATPVLGAGLPRYNIKRRCTNSATPIVKERVENMSKCLLFDMINDILARMLLPYKIALQPWMVQSKAVLRHRPVGKQLVKEVWDEICELGGLKCGRLNTDKAALKANLESLVARDFHKDQLWLGTDNILEKLCVDLEQEILKDLIEDTMLTLYLSSRISLTR